MMHQTRGDDGMAAAWGEHVALCLSQEFGDDLNAVLRALGIRLAVAWQDQPEFPLPRLAVWQGDTRTIRLFQQPLLRQFPDWNSAARHACAHELFHALAATRYRSLPLAVSPPVLSHRAEEIAAAAFARVVAPNFRLTLENGVLNFDQR